MRQHTFTAADLAADYDYVADYFGGGLTAYRAKVSGILRIIDNDSGCCLLAQDGNPWTEDVADARDLADNMMSVPDDSPWGEADLIELYEGLAEDA